MLASAFRPLSRLYDRSVKLVLDPRFKRPIIRTSSGAVETENSLSFKELDGFWQCQLQVIEAGNEVLTAACNAVEFASR